MAKATGLQESAPGVRSVVRAIRTLTVPSNKEISRATGLPIPLVAAVSSELRKRQLLSTARPAAFTHLGHRLLRDLGMDLSVDATCPECGGREIVLPSVLEEAVEQLTDIMESGPMADLSLDQSHATARTKVLRVMALFRAGVLPGGSLLLVGDDDLVSLALLVVGDVLGSPLLTRIGVVDISPDILGYISDVAADFGVRVDTVQHDLRDPLPSAIRGQFEAAMTDPPYTAEGARLFLARAIEGLVPGPGRSIFFSFGAKGPNDALEVQREIVGLGLATQSMVRNFNEYEGSGILGGTGSIQQLVTTNATLADAARYDGPLYTRDRRSRQREYACARCGSVWAVGPGAQWSSVKELQAAGCPSCGDATFRPGRLVAPTAVPSPVARPAQDPASEKAAPVAAVHNRFEDTVNDLLTRVAPCIVRPAEPGDLDAIADFEVDIARRSFGEDAVDDPNRHRSRMAKAMAKSSLGMFVASGPEPGSPVVGWMWMSVNQNSMTGARFANFRSLATAEVENRSALAELLIARGLQFATDQGLTDIVGKVYSGNLAMRTLYRRFGFEAMHLTMELKLPAAGSA